MTILIQVFSKMLRIPQVCNLSSNTVHSLLAIRKKWQSCEAINPTSLSQLARLSSSGVSESVVYILFTGQVVGC